MNKGVTSGPGFLLILREALATWPVSASIRNAGLVDYLFACGAHAARVSQHKADQTFSYWREYAAVASAAAYS